MSLISVIVPVYNVEKYLEKCIESIIVQTYKKLEIIIINDGSTDRSGSICEEYAKKDFRIRYIIQKNSGLGRTRNRGIKEANGEYILFIDSDDYIECTMIERLYQNIVKSKADVASCGIYNVFQKKCTPQYDKIEQFLVSAEEAFGLLLVGAKIPGSSCNKLYRADVLNTVRFPEGVLYEDVAFHTELMQKVRNIYVDTTPMYYYVHREESITTRKFDSAAMTFITFYEDALRVVETKYPSIQIQARFKLFWAYFAILDRILQENDYKSIPEYPRVVKYLKRNTFRIVRNPYFQNSRKIGAVVLLLNVRLYRLLIQMNDKKNKGIIA